MRLIDADALLIDIENTIKESGCVNHESEIMDCIEYAMDKTYVNCEECIHWIRNYVYLDMHPCGYWNDNLQPPMKGFTKPRDFCSKGRAGRMGQVIIENEQLKGEL